MILGAPGEKLLLLGNEAIARGAIEAGVHVAAGYPGTPSTEIIDTLAGVADKVGMIVDWSTNEKVALETAYAASMCRLRALATMKHVGLNVAADVFMSIGYSGVRGGLVIVSADDPGCHSSQNEQDNRYYSLASYIPCFEPYCPQEAKDLIVAAYDFSEENGTAILFRVTTRICHTRGEVVLDEIKKIERKAVFEYNPSKWVLLPANSRKLRVKMIERLNRIEEKLTEFKFNKIEGEGKVGIIASGIGYAYAVDALRELDLCGKVKVLKLSTPHPLPTKLLEKFTDGLEKILVVEEGDSFLLRRVKEKLYDFDLRIPIYGKGDLLPLAGELDLLTVMRAVAKICEKTVPEPIESIKLKEELEKAIPVRPPTLCPGCPHRATYYSLKQALRELGLKIPCTGDIGCYTLGYNPPFQLQDTSTCMGASIGEGAAIARFTDKPVVAVIGDSTFYHAGIPGLINAVYTSAPLLVVVMDNSVTAMTGHQPHPGTGITATGKPAKIIKIEDIAKACGVEFVKVVDPYNVGETKQAIKDALEYVRREKKPAVVVARRLCALVAARKGLRGTPPTVEDCRGCMVCINTFACPALIVEEGKVKIDEGLCFGCMVCTQICPFGTIKVRK